MNVHVNLVDFDGIFGYDLEIISEEATVQDYIDALNLFQENYVASCKGCDNCCWERIPLTFPDVIKYLENQEIKKMLPQDLPPLTGFLYRFCHIFGEGPVLDISLNQKDNHACIFLDQEEKICCFHQARSLVCQTFVCLPHSERAEELRSSLLNAGEDELVRRYLLEAQETNIPIKIDEVKNAAPKLEDYPSKTFSDKTHYSQVRIKEVLSEKAWELLYLPPENREAPGSN